MSLDTIGSIATHIVEMFPNLSPGISGNMVDIVDISRQNVANFTNTIIGSNSINLKFTPPIINFTKADVVDLTNAQADGGKIKLEDLSIDDSSNSMSAQQYRMLADMSLKNLGRGVQFVKSLS